MIKTYKDEIVPEGGRKYEIETDESGKSSITDVTEYIQEGSTFNSTDIQGISILEVTHSKTSSTHSLITENTLAENIKFTATATWNAGDTLKINNITYSVSDNKKYYFSTGDEVFAFLNNTNRTVQFISENSLIYLSATITEEAFYEYILSLNTGIYSLVIPSATATNLKLLTGSYFVLVQKRVNYITIQAVQHHNASCNVYYKGFSTSEGGINNPWQHISAYVISAGSSTNTLESYQNYLLSLQPGFYDVYSSRAISQAYGLDYHFYLHHITVRSNGMIHVDIIPHDATFSRWIMSYHDNEWFLTRQGFASFPITANSVQEFVTALENLDNSNYKATITSTVAAAIGLESKEYMLDISKTSNTTIAVTARPFDDALVEWRGVKTSTWSGFSKIVFTATPV